MGNGISALSLVKTQLKKSLNWYETQIEDKKQIISNLDRQLNQKVFALEEKLMVQEKVIKPAAAIASHLLQVEIEIRRLHRPVGEIIQ